MEIMNNDYGKNFPVTFIYNHINEELLSNELSQVAYEELKEYFEGVF